MSQGVKVHTGTVTYEGGRARRAAWVETSIRLQLKKADLLDALGSRYYRYRVLEDHETAATRPASLPAELTLWQILAACREEFEYWGIQWSMWSDDLPTEWREGAVKWLEELLTNAVPEIEEDGAYVETSLKLEPEWNDLAAALGSKYLRGVSIDGRHRPGGLPQSLTQRQMLKAFREEINYWGTDMNAWSEDIHHTLYPAVQDWLKELVTEAFPEMKEYMK